MPKEHSGRKQKRRTKKTPLKRRQNRMISSMMSEGHAAEGVTAKDFSPSTFTIIKILLLLLALSTMRASADTPKVQFNRDIRPILSENCFACHGPDRNKRQSNLRLDLRQDAMARGVLAPGHPEKSPLVARITAVQSGLLMPPVASHKKLTQAQRNLLIRWIKEGAE